jgi:hypothetical protein
LIKEERRSKFGNEPSTGFNKCNGLMLRLEGRRKRFEVRGRKKFGNEPAIGILRMDVEEKDRMGKQK